MISLLRRTTFAAIAIFATAGVPARAQAISEPFAVHFLETIANGAFQRTGYNIVASASHTTGTYTQGSASNHLDAQFTFIAARQSTVPPVESARFTFIGQGTYDFSRSGQVQLHPERFVRGAPAPQRRPQPAWINPPAPATEAVVAGAH